MSARKNTDTVFNGIAIGAVALAVLVLFAVFLPKAEASTPKLPDHLPGGLIAADTDAAWSSISSDLINSAKQQGYTDEQIQQSLDQYKQQLETDRSSVESGFDKASDVKATSRIYIDDQLTTYAVQAFAAHNSFIAPTPFEGASSELKVIGGVTCILTTSTSSDGSTQSTGTECQMSDSDYTVQVTSSDDAKKVAAATKAALDSLR